MKGAGVLIGVVLALAGCGGGGGLSADEEAQKDAEISAAYETLKLDVQIGEDVNQIGYDTGYFIGRVRRWVQKGMSDSEARRHLRDAATLLEGACGGCVSALDRERETISDE